MTWDNFEKKVERIISGQFGVQGRAVSLRSLSEELFVVRSENPSGVVAPPRCDYYPLQFMESYKLIEAFHRWMQIAGEDGIFVEGKHGRSDDLPSDEPVIFADMSAMIACDLNIDPSKWPFLYSGLGYRKRQDAKIFGKQIGGYPDPQMQRCINQSYLELIVRRQPAVMRLSAQVLPGLNVYDRLWLPIADSTGRIIRFICVVELLSSVFFREDD